MTWIMTGTGAGRFDYCKVSAAAITPEDIIVSLARTARFRGMGLYFYSVAQHSLLVGYLLLLKAGILTFEELTTQGLNLKPGDYGERLMQLALLHDGTETYMADISNPLKQLLPGYKAIETQVETSVYSRFGIEGVTDQERLWLKQADFEAALIERDFLFPDNKKDWEGEEYHPGYKFHDFFAGAFYPDHAQQVFAAHFAQYFPQVTGHVH